MTARPPRTTHRHDAAPGKRQGERSSGDEAGAHAAGPESAAIGNSALDLSAAAVVNVGQPVADRVERERRWTALAGARADGSPQLIAGAEDAVFRCYLPLASAMAAAVRQSAAGELEQAAELGLAQAVLGWRRSDGVGFEDSARRAIDHRLRVATARGWTAPSVTALGRVTAGPGAAGGRVGTAPDAQAVEVAMLDRAGVIVSVNDAWREFSAANDGNGSRTGVGMSYLAVCDGAGDDVHAQEVASAIRAAASGDLPAPVTVVVPCHSPAVQRWYDVLVSPRLNRQFRTIGVAVTLTLRASAPVR